MTPKLESKILRLAFAHLSCIDSRQRHFTFITQRNKIICFGRNRIFHSHPLAAKFLHRFADIHSELAAISAFPYSLRELRDYEIINLRVRRLDNSMGISIPCPHCVAMLISFNVKSVTCINRKGEWEKIWINI